MYSPALSSVRPGLRCALLMALAWLGMGLAKAQGQDLAVPLFNELEPSLFVVEVFDLETQKVQVLGSGFRAAPGIIATNYHVLSSTLDPDDSVGVRVRDGQGGVHAAVPVAVDVIGDLALLREESGTDVPLTLAGARPAIGETVFSLGNPRNLGITVISGSYSGVKEASFYPRIHFSGAINSGMSGGPAVNRAGEVIGVNVASYGDGVGFLVPVDRLAGLLEGERSARSAEQWLPVVEQQLLENQARLFDEVFAQAWPTETLREARVVGDVFDAVLCTGDARDADEDDPVSAVALDCAMEEDVFVRSDFFTGAIQYEFRYSHAPSLSEPRFYAVLGRLNAGGMFSHTWVGADHVSGYRCIDEVIRADAQFPALPAMKTTLCIRRYTDFPRLHDVLFLGNTLDRGKASLLAHFALSGVSAANARRFLARFLGALEWAS